MAQMSDTSNEAEEVRLELLRRMSPAQRVQLSLRLSGDVIAASKRAIARLHPEFSPREVGEQFVELQYGRELANGLRQYERMRDHASTE